MRDVDGLRRELARHALRHPAQRELAHREGCGLGIAFDAGRSAGEKDRAGAFSEHTLHRALSDEEGTEGAYHQRPMDFVRIERREGTSGAGAGVIDHDVR